MRKVEYWYVLNGRTDLNYRKELFILSNKVNLFHIYHLCEVYPSGINNNLVNPTSAL